MSSEYVDIYNYEETRELTLSSENTYVSAKLDDLVNEIDTQGLLEDLLSELILRFGTSRLVNQLTNLITQEKTCS